MKIQAAEPTHVVGDLLNAIPELRPEEPLLVDIARTAPPPNMTAIPPLLRFLRRVVAATPWLPDETSIPWANTAALSELETRVHQGFAAITPKLKEDYTRHAHLVGYTTKYPIYAALFEERRTAQPELEQLRALLLICSHQWNGDLRNGITGNGDALNTLAAAIRGARGKPSASFSDWLHKQGVAQSRAELARIVGNFENCPLKGLATWAQHHYLPALTQRPPVKGHVRRIPPVEPIGAVAAPSPPATSKPPSPDATAGRRATHRHETLRPFVPRIITKEIGFVDGPQSLRGESPEEAQGRPIAAILPAPSRNLATARNSVFRARQSIWGRNHLLLTEHPESLLVPEARIVAKALMEQLTAEAATNETSAGAIWPLLSLVTGRAPASLCAVRILTKLSDAPTDQSGAHWDMAIADRAIRLPALPPQQAFKPDTAESRFLEPTVSYVELPILPTIAQVAGKYSLALSTPHTLASVQHAIEDACRHLAVDTGIAVTPGRLRRTFASVVQDVGRNLPATLLICGDPMGQSIAPLYYYSPRLSDLADIYLHALASIFDINDAGLRKTNRSNCSRVGSRLLATEDHLRAAAQALGTLNQGGASHATDIGKLAKLHNSLATHVVGMLLCIAGHRPTDALFAIRRGDIDFNSGLAIFADKRVDAAHWTRLAVLAPTLVHQLEAYLDHLRGLAERTTGATRHRIGEALNGTSPLLFQIAPTGEIEELTMDRLRANLPTVWRRLPLNFGRTSLYTRGVEAGARPEALAIQLGHLDAVGFPWGGDGPTEPLLLAAELQPSLEKLAKKAGWRVRHGCSPSSDTAGWAESNALKYWRADIHRHEGEVADAVAAARAARRAQGRQYRLRAESNVIDILHKQVPVLAAVLASNAKPAADASLESLDEKAVAHIQDELVATAPDQAQCKANLNALARLMKRARDKFGYDGHVPGGVFTPGRSEASPFFPNMMLARTQIMALRRFYQDANRKRRPRRATGDAAMEFAWAALALTLFGFVEREQEVLGVLNARNAARRSAALPDLLLVEWSTEPRRVSGLRGLAAIALAALARTSRTDPTPSAEDIDHAMAAILPAALVGGSTGVLTRLCETVHVCNLIELSGAARLALDPERGSVPAPVDQQIAWFDRDPTPTSPVSLSSSISETATKASPHRRGEARKQYREMLAVFPKGSTTTQLPRTGQTITAADVARGRTKLVAELAAWESDPATSEVDAMLAHWSVSMLREGTTNKANPALSTVHDYLTAVGSQLVTQSEGIRLTELEDVDLAQLYLDCVEIKPSFARARTAREILNFHATVADPYCLAPIDESELASFLPYAHRSVDAELITPAQRDAALYRVATEVRGGASRQDRTLRTARLYRQAGVILDFQSNAGPRFGEAAGMHLRDVATSGSTRTVLRIVANRNRALKTVQSNRSIDLSPRSDGNARIATLEWVEAERLRLGDKAARHAYLACSPESTKDLSAKPELRTLVCRMLGAATGRASERDHRLRHCCGAEGILSVCLSPADRELLPWLSPLTQPRLSTAIPLPRDLHQQSRVLGQSTPTTTVCSYFHTPWAMRSRADDWIATNWLGRRSAATAMGVTPFAIDRISQRHKGKPSVIAWLDGLMPPRTIPLAGSEAPVEVRHASLTAVEVDRILGWTSRLRPLDATAVSLGASRSDREAIHAAAVEYASKLGRGYLPVEDILQSRASTVRVRRLKGASHLLRLLDIADGAEGEELRSDLLQVTEAHFAWSKAVNSPLVVIPARYAQILSRLLVLVGHPKDRLITRPTLKAGLVALQILDPIGRKHTIGRLVKRILGIVWIVSKVATTATDP